MMLSDFSHKEKRGNEMKYVTPIYDMTIALAEDVLTASSEKYEVEQNNNGSGSVIINAFNLFK